MIIFLSSQFRGGDGEVFYPYSLVLLYVARWHCGINVFKFSDFLFFLFTA